MSNAIQSALSEILTPDFLKGAAASFGEPEGAVSKGMSAAIPALLGSLGTRAAEPSFMQTLFGMVTSPDNDPGLLDKPSSLLGSAAAGLPMMALGGKLLSSVFGNKTEELTADLAGFAGLSGKGAKSLMGLASPLLLGVLGKFVRSGNLNIGALAKMLIGAGDDARSALPSGFSLSKYLPAAAAVAPAAAPVRPRPAPVVEGKKSSIWRWLLPLLLGLIALWLLSNLFGGDDEPEVVSAPVVVEEETVEVIEAEPDRIVVEEVQERAVAVVEDVEDDDDSFRERRAEEKADDAADEVLVAEVEEVDVADDAGARVTRGRPTAVVYFDPDSATLPLNTKGYLLPVVRAMEKNPTATAYISPTPFDSGDSAANLALTAQRARGVRDALVTSGVPAERIKITGPVEAAEVRGDEIVKDQQQVQVRVRK